MHLVGVGYEFIVHWHILDFVVMVTTSRKKVAVANSVWIDKISIRHTTRIVVGLDNVKKSDC